MNKINKKAINIFKTIALAALIRTDEDTNAVIREVSNRLYQSGDYQESLELEVLVAFKHGRDPQSSLWVGLREWGEYCV